MIELLSIMVVSVFVADFSGAAEGLLKRPLSKWLGVRIDSLRPFDCSLCLCFWISTIYLIATGFSWGMWAVACVLSAMTPAINESLHTMRDFIIDVLRLIQGWTKRHTNE